MPKKKNPPKDYHTSSKILTLRLKNDEIDAIDAIVEFSEFNSRNECVRHLLQPALAQFVTAINTKSAWKGGIAKISAEMDLNKRLKLARENSDKNRQLEIPAFEEIDMEVAPA